MHFEREYLGNEFEANLNFLVLTVERECLFNIFSIFVCERLRN